MAAVSPRTGHGNLTDAQRFFGCSEIHPPSMPSASEKSFAAALMRLSTGRSTSPRNTSRKNLTSMPFQPHGTLLRRTTDCTSLPTALNMTAARP
jgi:hypothetical protein